ncbi:MAG: hypothetical protein AAF715_30460 [Myxococcota bacterium]
MSAAALAACVAASSVAVAEANHEKDPPSDDVAFERPITRTDVYPTECGARAAEDVAAAKGLHAAAKWYFARERFAEAAEAWTESYRFDCTAHALLRNIAAALERLGDDRGAQHARGQYLARAPEPYATGAVRDYLEGSENSRALEPSPPMSARARTPAPVPMSEPVSGETSPSTEPPATAIYITLVAGGLSALAGATMLTVGRLQTLGSCPGAAVDCTRTEVREAEQGIALQHAGGVTTTLGVVAALSAGVALWVALDGPDDGEPAGGSAVGGASPRPSWRLGVRPTGFVVARPF